MKTHKKKSVEPKPEKLKPTVKTPDDSDGGWIRKPRPPQDFYNKGKAVNIQ